MLRKTFQIGIGVALLISSSPAVAQYQGYRPAQPSVEVDLSILGIEETEEAQAPAKLYHDDGPATMPVPLAPVVRDALPPPKAPATTGKRLLKPFFTAPEPATEPTPAPVPPTLTTPTTNYRPYLTVPDTQPFVTEQMKAPVIKAAPKTAPGRQIAKPARKPQVPHLPAVAEEQPLATAETTAPAVQDFAPVPPDTAKLTVSKPPLAVIEATIPAVPAATPVIEPHNTPAAAIEDTVDLPIPDAPTAVQAVSNQAPAPQTQEKTLAVTTKETPAIKPMPAPVAEKPATPVVPRLSDLSLIFEGDSSELTQEIERRLKNILPQLEESNGRRLQLRAFATGEKGSKSSARRISLSRALSVRSFLMDNGIKPTRVDVRAMGSETERSPLDRVDLIFMR